MSELTTDSLWGAYNEALDLYTRARADGNQFMMRLWHKEMHRILVLIENNND